MNKKLIRYFLVIVPLLFLFPFLVLLILNNSIKYGIGSINSWVGFYGSYFGAIISGFVVFLGIFTQQFLREKEETIKEKDFIKFITNYYFKTIKDTLLDSLEILKNQTDPISYIPICELFYDSSYFEKISKSKIKNEYKYFVLNILSKISLLNFLLNENIRAHREYTIVVTNKNIDKRLIEVVTNKELDTNVGDNIESIFKECLYSTLENDRKEYINLSKEVIEEIDSLMLKESQMLKVYC